MKNTQLFQFKFVDRSRERETLFQFLNNRTQCNILWINGASGVGKTYFIEKNILEPRKEGPTPVVYFNQEASSTAAPYLTQFIKVLSEVSKISFLGFIRDNYDAIFDVTKKVAVKILSTNALNDFGLVENGLNLTKHFLTKDRQEHHTLVKVVDNYLRHIASKAQALIILDNFTRCDEESLDIFSTVLHKHQGDQNLQFVLVTTEEQLRERLDILTLLSEKIDVLRITLNPFSSSTYFFEILDKVFDLRQCQQEDIQRLFQVCKGLPQKLKIFLMNLYSQDGINYQSEQTEKAMFVYDKLYKLLQRELIDFDYDGLPQEEKFILKLVTEWGVPIELGLLQKLVEYIANVDISLQEFTGSIFRRALLNLENVGILEKTYEVNTCHIKVKHDSIYYAVSQLLREDPVKTQFIHYSMLQFLEIERDRFSQRDRAALEAYHSFCAKAGNWKQANAEYGLELANDKQYIKAQKVLDRLSDVIRDLTAEQVLAIANNAYNAGEYEKADSVLDLLTPEALTIKERFLLQTTRCRTAMMRLNYTKAISSIGQLLDGGDALSAEQHLEALYLKEVALCLTPGGYSRAKRLFREIVRQYDKTTSPFWMERIYRTAMDYYRGNTSKKYLRQALEISQALPDKEEEAKATHNLGFEHFRCGEYSEAMDCFQKSRTILENIKPHEMAYCLNNIAAVHMARANYKLALDALDEAAFWNRSDYASVTIKGNQLICHYFSGQFSEANQIKEELLQFAQGEPQIDDKVYKKIYTNLAVILMDTKDTPHAANLLKQCLPHLKTDTPYSSARVKKLLHMLGDAAGETVHLLHYVDYYLNLPFEPWVLTFGNE